jgi:hypothetical protein
VTDLDGLVQVAYLHGDTVSHSWHDSMTRLLVHDMASEQPRITSTNGPFMLRTHAGQLVEHRNLAVKLFLDETPHEWLFMVDTDMGFAADTVDRLVAAADPAERPVVGALCFSLQEVDHDGMGGRRSIPAPTVYQMARSETDAWFTIRWEFPADTVIPVAGTGAACILIHRTAVEKIRAEHGDTWFDRVRYTGDGRLVGEDLAFCYRLRTVGLPVYVHTGIKTTHHKQVWIGADDYRPETMEQLRGLLGGAP